MCTKDEVRSVIKENNLSILSKSLIGLFFATLPVVLAWGAVSIMEMREDMRDLINQNEMQAKIIVMVAENKIAINDLQTWEKVHTQYGESVVAAFNNRVSDIQHLLDIKAADRWTGRDAKAQIAVEKLRFEGRRDIVDIRCAKQLERIEDNKEEIEDLHAKYDKLHGRYIQSFTSKQTTVQ